MRHFRRALFSLLLLGWASTAYANGDAAEAAKAFAEGRTLYAAGKYSEAASRFERANELAPHPVALFNAATAWDQAGYAARAADSYEMALRGDLDKASRESAEKRMKELQAELGVLEVKAPAGTVVSVDGRSRREFPARLHLRPGAQSVLCQLPLRGSRTKQVEIVAGQTASLDLASAEPAESQTQTAKPPAAMSDREKQWRVAGWVGVGLSGGLAVTSALIWDSAKSERDALVRGDRSARDRAETLQTWTNVTLISSVALGAAGVTVLLVRPGRRAESAAVRLRVGREVSVSGTF